MAALRGRFHLMLGKGIAKLLASDCEGLGKGRLCHHFRGVICPEAEGIETGVAV